MEEHDRLEEEAKFLVETLQLLVVAIGVAVLACLGSPILKPMLMGLVLFFPCNWAMKLYKR